MGYYFFVQNKTGSTEDLKQDTANTQQCNQIPGGKENAATEVEAEVSGPIAWQQLREARRAD